MTDLRSTAPLSRPTRARRMLRALDARSLNFDVERRDEFTADRGWEHDHYRQPLPSEAPGDPRPGGSWARCRELMNSYAFADPAIVRALYDADVALADRNMVLEGRFYGLRFLLGLRIGGVVDDTIMVGGRPVRRWGWHYRTLQGHLEMGQMDYAVHKWTDTGDVEFRIDAVSKAAPIRNPIVRLGFLLFGRWMQRRFARRGLRRMDRMVRAGLTATDDMTGHDHRPTRGA